MEVPISWIDSSDEMGVSDFRIFRFAPSYVRALADLARVVRARHERPHRV